MEDILIIYSKILTKHITYVHQVPQKLCDDYLFVKAKKCEQLIQCSVFQIHILSPGPVQMESERTAAVTDRLQLKMKKGQQQF